MEDITTIVIQMDGNYPDISSGIVSFENSKTGAKISLRPADLESGIYGVKSITMDSGAGYTILPEGFATLWEESDALSSRLDISRPEEERASYYIFSGVGGTSVCFLSPDPLYLGIEDMPGNKVVKEITPFFLTSYAPSITSEGQLLAQEEHQPQTSQVIDFISPPFKHCDEYTVKVSSPNRKFPPQDRRLKLEVDIGKEMDYILIGRDWQEEFKLTFEAQRMIIEVKERA